MNSLSIILLGVALVSMSLAVFFAIALLKYHHHNFVPSACGYLLENLSAGVLIVDNRMCVTFVNKAFQQIFPSVSITYNDELVIDLLSDYPEICDLIIASDKISVDFAVPFQGQIHHYQVGVTNFSSSNSKVVGKIIIFQDITNCKRSIQLQIDENISKNKFLSIIAHDLKSPFQTLIGLSELLIDDDFKENEKKKVYHAIHETSCITYDLLSDLLIWAMSQLNLIDFQPEPFEINQIFDIALLHAEPIIKNKNINVKSELDTPIEMFADKQMIQTVLRNLLSNAIKFSKEGSMVKINAYKENNETILTVSDTGIGLADEDIPKLFRIDVKNNEIGSRKEKGTGLGLILCSEFISKHGGQIWVKSKLGQGSTFYVSIPDSVDILS